MGRGAGGAHVIDGTKTLAYVVPGRPVTWARSAVVAGRTLTPAAQRKAKAAHRAHALATGITRRYWPLEGAFAVTVRSYYATAVVGDVDRAAGIALDALEGVAYHADRQVRSLVSEVVADGSPERVEVTVRRLDADPVRCKSATAKARRVMR